MAHSLIHKCILSVSAVTVLLCAMVCPVRAADVSVTDYVDATDLPQAIILWRNTKAEIIDPSLVTEEEKEAEEGGFFYEEELVSITTSLVSDGEEVIQKAADTISYTATFGTHFYLHFMPDVAQYVEGAVVPSAAYRNAMGGGVGYAGGGGGGSSGAGGAGLEIGDAGVSFEPPLIAALVCGGGYLVSATIFKAGIFRYGRKNRS